MRNRAAPLVGLLLIFVLPPTFAAPAAAPSLGWHILNDTPASGGVPTAWFSAVPNGYIVRTIDAFGEHFIFVPKGTEDWGTGPWPTPLGTPPNLLFDGFFLHLRVTKSGETVAQAVPVLVPLNEVAYFSDSRLPSPTVAGCIVYLEGGGSIAVVEGMQNIKLAIGLPQY